MSVIVISGEASFLMGGGKCSIFDAVRQQSSITCRRFRYSCPNRQTNGQQRYSGPARR